MINKQLHTFHIPVMGLAFTIDSPIRVAKYGISSVIALADDELIEKMRAFYCEKFDITEKACLCVGLANAAYIENDIEIKGQSQGVIICPGPNMAYFDKEVSLSDMVRHIYGNFNVMKYPNRPNLFVKELKMYVDYLKNDIKYISSEITASQLKKLKAFKNNLIEGIAFYQNFFANIHYFENSRIEIQNQLEYYANELLRVEVPELVVA